MAAVLPDYPQFDPDEDPLMLPSRWETWIDGLVNMLEAMAISDHARRFALLKHYAGPKCRGLEKHLPYDKTKKFGEDDSAAADHYRSLKEAYTSHFAPKKNVLHARFNFHSMKQDDGEKTDAYAARLREQASRCDFCNKNCIEQNVRDQIVVGSTSTRIRRKALAENFTLEKLLDAARAEESANAAAADIEKSTSVATPQETEVFKVTRRPGKYSNRTKMNPTNPPPEKKCYSCGGAFPHPNKKLCPARGKECLTCHRKGHFATVCRGGRRYVAAVEQEDLDDDDRQFFLHAIHLIGAVGPDAELVEIPTEFGAIKSMPDTGSLFRCHHSRLCHIP